MGWADSVAASTKRSGQAQGFITIGLYEFYDSFGFMRWVTSEEVRAVCSKSDEPVARKAIREHPEMLLREDDFSALQINWNDKATNLQVLAERLSLGLDSFVFQIGRASCR